MPSSIVSRLILFLACLCWFSLLAQLDLGTSGKGGLGNYIGLCAIVAVFGVADAHIEGGIVGDLSFMCPEFLQVTSNATPFLSFFSAFY